MEAFGYNVANTQITLHLRNACDNVGAIFKTDTVDGLQTGEKQCLVTLANGERHHASLVVGADGKSSVVRRLAGMGERVWRYPQTAIVLNFRHQHPHDDASTEFHTPTGPFTIVPLEAKLASLVWVTQPADAERILVSQPAKLAREIETKMESMLGRVEIVSAIQSFPLSGMAARRFGHRMIALVGEAAHTFPPIGAQGFNMGVRDVATLRDLAERGIHPNIGDDYHRRRQPDIGSRGIAIDLFNRSLLTDFLPVQLGRSIGIGAIGAIAPLRRLAMREGIAPGRQSAAIRGGFDDFRRALHRFSRQSR